MSPSIQKASSKKHSSSIIKKTTPKVIKKRSTERPSSKAGVQGQLKVKILIGEKPLSTDTISLKTVKREIEDIDASIAALKHADEEAVAQFIRRIQHCRERLAQAASQHQEQMLCKGLDSIKI